MQETKRFYSSLSLLVFLNAIVKPLWIFAIDRQVQNEVGVAAYGAYFSVFNLSLVLYFLLDLGLAAYFNRQLSVRDSTITARAGSFVFMKLVFALVYTLILFSIAYFTGIRNWHIVIYVVLIQVFLSMFLFFRTIITAQQWFRTDAVLSVLDKSLMVVLCGTLLYMPSLFGPISMDRFLILQAACMAVATLIALGVLVVRKFHFSFQQLWPGKSVLKPAIPFAILVLLMSFHARIDGFLLERISSAEEAGKYAAAYRLLEAANMPGYLFASFLLPFISRHQSERKNISAVILNVRHLLLAGSITLSCITIFLAPWIQRLLYHHYDKEAVEILQWCLPALTGYFLVHIYGTVLTATGHIVAFMYITLVSVILNLAINLFLIPPMGARGSCIAALISQGFSAMVTVWYVRKALHISIGLRSVLIYIFIAGLLSGFLYALKDTAVSKWWIIAGAGILSLLVLAITKLIDLKSWRVSVRYS